jgi:hypothetical protein
MIVLFGEVYLRETVATDTALDVVNQCGTGASGMIWSIEYMHWEWKNYPFAWQG